MGAWGPALYSDDFAADLRGDFRDHIGDGLTAEQALEKLRAEYAPSLKDPDEAPVFWLAVADSAWRLGRPIARATAEAMRVIESGADLKRWDEPKHRQKRERVLEELARKLGSTPPPAKRIPRRIRAATDWEVGELIAYRLGSGRWALFRVTGHHVDKGGRTAIVDVLEWVGSNPPSRRPLLGFSVRRCVHPIVSSQIMICEPKRSVDAARFVRTGLRSKPRGSRGGFLVGLFPRLDGLLREYFDLE